MSETGLRPAPSPTPSRPSLATSTAPARASPPASDMEQGFSEGSTYTEIADSSPPAYLVVRSDAHRNNRELRGIHFLPADDPGWTQAIAFLGAGGLEFAFLTTLRDARAFLGDPSAVPIVENSPLVPPAHSTAHRAHWPIFQTGGQSDSDITLTQSPGHHSTGVSPPATDISDSDSDDSTGTCALFPS